MAATISRIVQALEPSATMAMAAKAKELKASGRTVYDLSLGEPDFSTPAHICQAALEAMEAGHTHFARIVVDDRSQTLGGAKSGFFALVDCGAWIEECSLDGEIVPNAQIGIMYNNDIRIYQLSPKK